GGVHVVDYVFDSLRKFNAQAVPVLTIGSDKAIVARVAKAVAIDERGIGLRARFEDIMRPTHTQSARDLMQKLSLSPGQVDLILDLGSPNYEPYATFAGALVAALRRLGDLAQYRNFVLVGTAMPDSLSEVTKDGAALPRHDWLFYKELAARLPAGMRRPSYGD